MGPQPVVEPRPISVLEIRMSGENLTRHYSRDQFITSLSQYKLPLRDLRMLLKPADTVSYSGNRSKFPALLPRPSSKCYIFEMEHIKLICFSDRCLIFNPGDKATQRFVDEINDQFRAAGSDSSSLDTSLRMRWSPGGGLDTICNVRTQDFEHVILESALENVVNKFRRHITIKKPALEMLLQQIEQDPETNGLKRLLAVKKSLSEFEQRVDHVMKVVQHLLVEGGKDLVDLYLSRPDQDKAGMEEIKLLMEAYQADLDEIETETKIFTDLIEDTDQFISAHLDSVRNEIIKLSLYIELGALVMSSGAVVSGIFGMNLSNRLEEHHYAFFLVCSGILTMMCGFFFGFYKRYDQLRADTSSAHSFTLLKNFFTYVDDLEYHVFNKKTLNAKEFKEAVEKITKLKISDRESEYLFTMFDSNNDGNIDIEEELNIRRESMCPDKTILLNSSLSCP